MPGAVRISDRRKNPAGFFMKIQCPYCSGITELEHADHETLVECVCSRTFEINEQTVLEEYTEVDNSLPEKIGPYPVTGILGYGGMGKVYLGRHYALDIPVAIKVLRMEYMTDRSACERFIQAAKISAKLNHPNIVKVYDCGYLEENVFLVMEYIAGGSTRDLLEQSGPLQSDHASFIMLEVCTGLLEAERLEIVHRDIKPENIMFDQDGNVKILDLGLSKISGDKRLNRKTITGSLISLGTVQYMAPEQAVDAANCDSRADIYSMGVTLYQFCTGKLPFESEDHSELRRMHAQDPVPPPSLYANNMDPKMEQIILRCLGKKREDRYSSISELALDLEAVLKNRILPSTLNRKQIPIRKPFRKKNPAVPGKTVFPFSSILLPGAIFLCALLLAGGVFLLKNHFSAGKNQKFLSGERKNTTHPLTPEQLLNTLAGEAARFAEKNKFEEAARIYTDYNGPFAEETRSKRILLAKGYRISAEFQLKVPLEDGEKADKDSDRNP